MNRNKAIYQIMIIKSKAVIELKYIVCCAEFFTVFFFTCAAYNSMFSEWLVQSELPDIHKNEE